MSQSPLTNPERISALRQLGYTEREAAFLTLAALHGGYFLRRQYDHFLGQPDGGTAGQLIEKALAKGHAQAFTYRQRAQIYHLCARPFYAALGQPDNRNRRLRQPFTIKNKLMGLDFVLAHRDHPYLVTEQEKLDYFTAALKIPVSYLPAKLYRSASAGNATARYFVDKYPIFLAEFLASGTASGASPLVSFCFVDEGLTTLSKFETYLAQYRPLLASLPQFQLVYVAARATHFKSAERAFERFVAGEKSGNHSAAIDPEIRRLLGYFESRRQYESKQLDGFDREKLLRLRADREAFTGEKNEALYERWKAHGNAAMLPSLAPEIAAPARMSGVFSTCLLEHDYELFGSLTAF